MKYIFMFFVLIVVCSNKIIGQSLIYSNGPLITHPGGGFGGSDFSFNSTGMYIHGFPNSIEQDQFVCDNLYVNAQNWTVDSIGFYGYQNNSPLTSTFTDYHLVIYDGAPWNPGSSIIWGDTVNNIMSSTEWTGIYRGNDITNTTRPIMISYVSTSGLNLTGGEYYLVWRCKGSSNPYAYAPTVTFNDQPYYGNGEYYSAHDWWYAYKEFAFEVYGSKIPSSCPFPEDLYAFNISGSYADIIWTETGNATSWDIEVGVEGFVPSGSPSHSGIVTIPYTLTGLTDSTSYDVYVRSDCGNSDTSLWTGPYTFTTKACDILNECPITMWLWNQQSTSWYGAAISYYVDGDLFYDYTLTGSMTGMGGARSYCNGTVLDFIWNSGTNDNECTFAFYDSNDNLLMSCSDASIYTTGDTVFTYTMNCPTCPAPVSLGASNISYNSVELSWSPGGNETSWIIEYGNTGFIPGFGYKITVNSNPYTLTGLSSNTEYDYYIQSECATYYTSELTGPNQFTTSIYTGSDISSLKNLDIYPNPANEFIKVVPNEQEIKKIIIYNTKGEIIFTGVDHYIDISEFPNGLIIIKVITQTNVVTKKIVKM